MSVAAPANPMDGSSQWNAQAAQLQEQALEFQATLAYNRAKQAGDNDQIALQAAIAAAQQTDTLLKTYGDQALAALTQAGQQGLGVADLLSKNALGRADLASRQGLGVANLMASLQGPSNAFAYDRAISGVNSQGLSNSVANLTGSGVPPAFQALGPTSPITLQTIAGDTSNQTLGPAGSSGGVLGTLDQSLGSIGGNLQQQSGSLTDKLLGLAGTATSGYNGAAASPYGNPSSIPQFDPSKIGAGGNPNASGQIPGTGIPSGGFPAGPTFTPGMGGSTPYGLTSPGQKGGVAPTDPGNTGNSGSITGGPSFGTGTTDSLPSGTADPGTQPSAGGSSPGAADSGAWLNFSGGKDNTPNPTPAPTTPSTTGGSWSSFGSGAAGDGWTGPASGSSDTSWISPDQGNLGTAPSGSAPVGTPGYMNGIQPIYGGPTFNTAPNMRYQPPSASSFMSAGAIPSVPTTSQYSPQAQAYLNALPDPSAVNPRDWAAMPPYAQQVVLSGYASKGYDPASLQAMWAQMLPQQSAGPSFGLST